MMNWKKRVGTALCLCAVALSTYADEGMWILKELNKQNLARMAELGFKPSVDKLYNENEPCVANAVVIFGGGCTGITVSNEGLIFTNHHCGFGSIQKLSSVEHDYLKNGFVPEKWFRITKPKRGTSRTGLVGTLSSGNYRRERSYQQPDRQVSRRVPTPDGRRFNR